MIAVNDVEQLTPEWYALRAGCVTASCFDKLVTSKGAPSKQAQKYLYTLAGERIIGAKAEAYTNAAMERGIEIEDEARRMYRALYDAEVQQVGFVFKDDSRTVGCSPDGLIGAHGGLEIKCPILSTHVGYLIENKLPTDYVQQVQGSMYVTGSHWWDFLSYYPGLKPLLVRVPRDNAFIDKLDAAVTKAVMDLGLIISKIK